MQTPKHRPTKDQCYLDIAKQVALRSTCLRRSHGAVIVKEDEVIATGYGGSPRGTLNCTDVGYCYRAKIGAKKGEHYELCRAVHAEQNAIIQARRLDMLGSTLYLVGLDYGKQKPLMDTDPCPICRRAIINAGIIKVVVDVGREKPKVYWVEKWTKNNLYEFRNKKNKLIPVVPPLSLSDPADQNRQDRLISRFSLSEAIVIQTTTFEDPKHTVGRAAARFFTSNVLSGHSVAISCGDTILSLLEFLPYMLDRKLTIHQLSVEGDPATIHQAPATLVGLLRGKCSPQSQVFGLQLPPYNLTHSSMQLREEISKSRLLAKLRNEARQSDFVFMGIGSVEQKSASFWAVAQAATGGKFPQFVKKMGLVGEINNQVFDKFGNNCTDSIPGLSNHLLNVLSLDDIRHLAANPRKHKVVMVATGLAKTRAMQVALQKGFVNVLITGSEDADRLLGK